VSNQPDEPSFPISVAARLVELHPQTLRMYERLGLVKPARTDSNRRVYSLADIERLRQIARLTGELGVNLAGVEIILRLRERILEMQREMEAMQAGFEAELERWQRMAQSHKTEG